MIDLYVINFFFYGKKRELNKKKKIVKFKDDELDVNASTVEETI